MRIDTSTTLAPSTLTELGLPAQVTDIQTLRTRSDHAVYRLSHQGQSYILKLFSHAAPSTEVFVYALLARYSIPTLPIYGQTSYALLLEDLKYSQAWRLATAADLDQRETGVAIATWYRSLHESGYRMLSSSAAALPIKAWVDNIDEAALLAAAHRLDCADAFTQSHVFEELARLKALYYSAPQTFNYNDFALENLALSQTPNESTRAIVFDYDQFSLGAAYSDWRNVVGSLTGPAREGFIAAYGPVSDVEKAVDEPLSVLDALIIASQRPTLPKWAAPLLRWVTEGNLTRSIKHALQYVQ